MQVEWSLLQPTGPVPEARWGATATLMNGQLYLFGGASDEETLSDLWTLRLGEPWVRPPVLDSRVLICALLLIVERASKVLM